MNVFILCLRKEVDKKLIALVTSQLNQDQSLFLPLFTPLLFPCVKQQLGH